MIVCSCFGVSSAQIEELLDRGADSVAAVAAACGAGTDCGSCRSQIRELIDVDENQYAVRPCSASVEEGCTRARAIRRLVIRAA